MSNLAHRFDRDSFACVCGSEWNVTENGCSSLYPLAFASFGAYDPRDDFDYPEQGECRKGHLGCSRH